MGYRSLIHTLDLPDYADAENPENSLVVKVVAPSLRESSSLNNRGDDETSAEFTRRAFTYLAPKIRFWNLETEDGEPIPLPRDVSTSPEEQVDHLYEQDENIMLAIYHEWRLVSLPKKADTDEGKDSAEPSMPGLSGSLPTENWPTDQDIRELERSIPMG